MKIPMLFLFALVIILPCALCGKGNKDTPTKNEGKKSKDEGPSKAKSGINVLKTITGFLALQKVGLAHGTQTTPSEVTTFKVPAVNNQNSTPEMIKKARDTQLKAFCIAQKSELGDCAHLAIR
uniref:Secreted protein n=1 Tax=Globodera pallida TaxID=36090 RepID=A0A183BJY7_GLOPA